MAGARAYRIYYLIASALIIIGIVLLGYSIATGQGSVSLVVIIPIFVGTGLYAGLGVLCIIAGMFVLFFGFSRRWVEFNQYEYDEGVNSAPLTTHNKYPHQYPNGVRKKTKTGGVILIGPIPIIFGSDTSVTKSVIILAIVLTGIAVAIFLIFWARILF